MRFLTFSDLHCHNYSQFSSILLDGTNSRLLDCLSILDQMENYGIEHRIKKILFLGDLFNSRTKVAIDVYCRVYNKLEEMKLNDFEFFLIVGNHDQFLKSGEIHSLRPLSGVAEVYDQPGYISALNVWAVPYADSCADRKLFIKAGLETKATILAIHTPVSGAIVGPAELALGSELKLADLQFKKFKLVLLGDYHRAQSLLPNVFYLGSPLQLNLGERNDGQKGFWEVDTEANSIRMIFTEYPKFIEVEGEDWDEEMVRGNFVKVMIGASQKGDDLELKKKILVKGARAVVVERQIEEKIEKRLEIEPDMSFEEMLKKFVENAETELDKGKLIKMGTGFLKGDSG